MNCPACESQNRPGAQRCRACAAALPPTCQSCGTQTDSGVELCPTCRASRLSAALGAEDLFSRHLDENRTMRGVPYELRPPFVGRSGVLERIAKAFDDTRELHELAFVALVGPPGAGKTRLIHELARSLEPEVPQARFLVGSAGGMFPIPYAGLARILATRFGITARDPETIARDKIIAGVSEVLPAAKVTEVAHLIAHLLRVGFPQSRVLEPLAESPQQLEARMFIAVRRFLAADAAKSPLILCVDDLHQAGPETINLLHYLAAGLMSSPVMLLAVARPSLYDAHPSFGDGEAPLLRVDLGPLEEEEAGELLRELLAPVANVPPALFAQAKSLGGTPRTLFQFVQLLLEAEVIVRAGETSPHWEMDLDRLSQLDIPDDQDELLALRLKVMPAAELDLLEKAAACGEVFWLDAVVSLVRIAAIDRTDPDGPTLSEIAAAGDHTRLSVGQTLGKLVDHTWLVAAPESQIPGEREYHFAHPPLWDVVYGGIEDDSRRRYHRRMAQWLELRPEGRTEDSQEQVGRHLERAGDGERAADCYRRAADAARLRYYNDKAIRLYARALACLGEDDVAARICICHDLGSVYELKGDFDAALGAFERMLRLSWVISSRTKAAVAFNKLGRVFRRRGELKVSLEYLERGRELFEQANDLRGIASSLDDIGNVLWLTGRYDEAFEKITQALQKRGQMGDKRSIAHSLSDLGNLQKDRGKLTESERCHREALALRRQIDDRAGVVLSLNNLAALAFLRGDRDEARRGWEQSLAQAEDIGALPCQAMALNNLGELSFSEGKLEEARRRLEDALGVGKDLDDRRLLSEATRNLGALELLEGNTGKARDLAVRALDLAESSGFRDYIGRALVALGEVHAATLFDTDGPSSTTSAEDFFLRGVQVFRDMGNETELARGLERFGRYKLEQGEVGSGRGLLEEAARIFSKLGMKQGEEVSRMLGEL